MPLYESIFIARQDVPAAQVETLTQSFADIIVKDGGKVKKTEQWGLRNLAYRIKKNKKGHYVLFNLDAPPEAVAEMERNMGLNEDVLRFMTVRVEEHEEGPSAIMRKDERSDRPSFGDRGGDRGDRGFDRPRRAPRSETASEGDAA
ncbi:MAG: 30S ribosomal protein S6 [Alphaproteobacteria bacterium]|nr:30S ribosomal protein S6 [Alphaproteobacteria bacterium]